MFHGRGMVGLLLCTAASTAPGMPDSGPATLDAVPAAELPKPAVTWMVSPNVDDRTDPAGVTAIVIHDTQTPGVRDARIVAHHFVNPRSAASAHFIIGKRGEIVQCVPESRRAWHAGPSMLDGVPRVNDYAIGIELVNAEDGRDPFTDPQYRSLAALTAHLVTRYAIPWRRIVGHRDVTAFPGLRHDPADNFSWSRYHADVAGRLAAAGITLQAATRL